MSDVPAPKKLKFSNGLNIGLMALIFLGLVSFVVGLIIDPQRAWANFLLDYFYWFCISAAGVFFMALQYITGATWSTPLRRIAESFAAFLPVALVLFIVLLFGLHSLFEWTHHHVVDQDALLKGKSLFLNTPFFIVRSVLLYGVCLGLGGWMIKKSLKQDQTGDAQITISNTKLSALFLILFSILFTLVSFDLMMSLAPHWFSTIFGVYCWAGLFYSGLAMITIWVIALRKSGHLTTYVNSHHLHDLGKLMFAFLVFWAYIGFSQFMLIWYANLPEETFYYIDRLKGGWEWVSIALMIVKFGIPFFMLISSYAKKSENFLLFVAVWFLVAQWIDIYWMVFPTFYKEPTFGWMEVTMFLGFAAAFVLSVSRLLGKVCLVALRDPFIKEGLEFHQ